MMSRIENISQLQSEISKLRLKAKEQERVIKNDLMEIKEDLKPQNILWNTFSSLTGIKIEKNEFLKNGIAIGISLLLQRFAMKTESKVEHALYDFATSIFERLKSILGKFSKSDEEKKEDESLPEDFISEK